QRIESSTGRAVLKASCVVHLLDGLESRRPALGAGERDLVLGAVSVPVLVRPVDGRRRQRDGEDAVVLVGGSGEAVDRLALGASRPALGDDVVEARGDR